MAETASFQRPSAALIVSQRATDSSWVTACRRNRVEPGEPSLNRRGCGCHVHLPSHGERVLIFSPCAGGIRRRLEDSRKANMLEWPIPVPSRGILAETAGHVEKFLSAVSGTREKRDQGLQITLRELRREAEQLCATCIGGFRGIVCCNQARSAHRPERPHH